MEKKYSSSQLALRCLISVLVTLTVVFLLLVFFLGGVDRIVPAYKFSRIQSVIESRYVGDADLSDIREGAYAGMIESVDDQWSFYMDSEDYDRYKLLQKNRYDGIGITIRYDEAGGGFNIVAVVPEGPADKAGIVPGDLLIAVNGEETSEMTVDQVRDAIMLGEGETASLSLRSESGVERSASVRSEMIDVEPVSYEMLSGNIAYITIDNFKGGVADSTGEAMDALLEEGAEGIIFDVRGNPGGSLSELTALLNRLLPEGEIFVSANKDGAETVHISDSECIEMPMAVLVDENSYSAAEFFAAALREYDWATVVGQQTTGKGRSQISIELFDGSAVHLSVNRYLTPHRVDLAEAGGITPDIQRELGEDEQMSLYSGRLDREDDSQLQAAIEEIRSLISSQNIE